MLTETIQLETLRQKIEDAEFESGNQSDYLDRGNPNPAQAQRARELIAELNRQVSRSTAELQQLIATTRSQQPQAFEDWVNFHVDILKRIVEDKATGANAVARRNVAKSTLQEWEQVRAGQQEYVRINWHFLKDYKAQVRTTTGSKVQTYDSASPKKTESKSWWQIWK